MDYTFDIVNALLSPGAETDPNLPHPKRSTPLLCAAGNVKYLRVLETLLCGGANVNAKNRYGQTALHIVAQSKPAEYAALLLSFGARVFVKDQHGETALDVAIKHGNVDVFRLLKILFYPLRSSELAPNICWANVFFQRIVAHWDRGGLPQFFLLPETEYVGPKSIESPKINGTDLKKVGKQLRRQFAFPVGMNFPELLEKLGYCFDVDNNGDLDSVDECVQDVKKVMWHDTIDG